MPFETVACTSCGSTDVQEVKPSTYFCNHCETVFKYVDPSRLRVEHSPAFCWCGNPIQVQCQLCRTEMCLQCDVAANRAAIYRGPGTRSGYGPNRNTMSLYGPGAAENSFCYRPYSWKGENVLPVPVRGFGYLHRDMDRRICGPFLYLSELLSTMTVAQGLHYTRDMIPAEHLCFACVATAVPATAERIANREICESPGCTDRPSQTCDCCGSSFCADCVTLRAYNKLGDAMWPKRRNNDDPDKPRHLFRHIFCTLPTGSVFLPQPEGLCLPCLGETVDKASGLAKQICEQEYQLQPAPPRHISTDLQPVGTILHYEVAEITVATKKARRAEISRQYETSARYAKDLTERMENYVKSSACQLQEAFRDKKYYASYAILDERGRTAPAALATFTGTAGDRDDRGSPAPWTPATSSPPGPGR